MTIHVDWLTLLVLVAIVGAAIVVWTRRWSSRRHEEPTANTLALDPVVELGSEVASHEETLPLIDVTPIEIDGNLPEIHVPDSVRTFLESTIQRSPSLVQSGQYAFDKGLRAVFSKEVTRALQSGDAILVKDAAGRTLAKARDAKSGRLLGSARAVAQGGSKALQVSAMAWQIASIATAQHYLGEINEKLKAIEDTVKDVLFMLEEADQSAIIGSIALLRQYYDALRCGELAKEDFPVIRQQVEHIEKQCLDIAGKWKAKLDRKRQELSAIEVHDWFGREATAKAVSQLIENTSKAMRVIFMAHSCRVMACQVRAALPNSHAFLKARLEHAKRDVEETAQVLQDLKSDVLKRLEGLKVRQHNPLALFGAVDSDHHRGLRKAYHLAQCQAHATRDILIKQADGAYAFSQAFDRIIQDGMSVDVAITSGGEMKILKVGPAA